VRLPFLALIVIPLLSLLFAREGIAAEPVLSFAELYKEYIALGLPMPPNSAKLMRVSNDNGIIKNGVLHAPKEELVFVVRPGSLTERPILFLGTFELEAEWAGHVREIKPDPSALEGIDPPSDAFILSFQCQSRGWDKLAKQLFELSHEGEKINGVEKLREQAWLYWKDRRKKPPVDRRTVIKHMKELIAKDAKLDTEENRRMIKGMELALEPSKAKPGSIEAMIDDLVNYKSNFNTSDEFDGRSRNSVPGEGYNRLAALGFDAVPTLIEHLDDERVTWGTLDASGLCYVLTRPLTIGDLAGDIVERLANEILTRHMPEKGFYAGNAWEARHLGYTIKKSAAKEWWGKAQKVGEEKYLLDHAFTTRDEAKKDAYVSEHILYVLSAKYPKQIPGLYKTVLDKRTEVYSSTLTESICKLSIPIKEKVDLLLLGAKHKVLDHRISALRALKKLDKTKFNALMLEEIEKLPRERPDDYEISAELGMVDLAIECDGPRIWQALQKTAKSMSVGLRMELLDRLERRNPRPHIIERLLLLESFMDDTTIRERATDKRFEDSDVGKLFKKIQIRDFAALKIAGELGIEIEVEKDGTPEEWAKIRELVRTILKKELDEKN
jgi:hypothetical protein